MEGFIAWRNYTEPAPRANGRLVNDTSGICTVINSILPNGMYDAQYHASAQNCTKIATSVRSASPELTIASSATPKASRACGELATAKGRQRQAHVQHGRRQEV